VIDVVSPILRRVPAVDYAARAGYLYPQSAQAIDEEALMPVNPRDLYGGTGGYDSDGYRQYMAEAVRNLFDSRFELVWASEEALKRHERWVEENAVRCVECDVTLHTPAGPILPSDVEPPGRSIWCNKCESARTGS